MPSFLLNNKAIGSARKRIHAFRDSVSVWTIAVSWVEPRATQQGPVGQSARRPQGACANPNLPAFTARSPLWAQSGLRVRRQQVHGGHMTTRSRMVTKAWAENALGRRADSAHARGTGSQPPPPPPNTRGPTPCFVIIPTSFLRKSRTTPPPRKPHKSEEGTKRCLEVALICEPCC